MLSVSIIIVNWNAKEYLLRCLQSLITEGSTSNTEIIIVDNASKDGSQEAIRQHFPYVKLICNDKNLGFARANNIAIRLSSGKYVCMINSDATVRNGCIDRMRSYMDENPGVGVLGPMILNQDLTLQTSFMEFPSLRKSFYKALGLHRILPHSKYFSSYPTNRPHQDTPSTVDVLSGCFWMVRRDAIEQVGLLDESFFLYLEDVDWCKRFHEAGWNVVYFPHAQAIHYGQASSSNCPGRFFCELLKSRLIYWRKHHGRRGQFAILSISLLALIMRIFQTVISYPFLPSQRSTVLTKLRRDLAGFRCLIKFVICHH